MSKQPMDNLDDWAPEGYMQKEKEMSEFWVRKDKEEQAQKEQAISSQSTKSESTE